MIPNPLHRFALLPCLAVLLGTSCQFVSGYGDLDKADHNPTTGGASSVGGLGGVGGVSGGTGGVGGTGGSIGGSGGGGFAGTGGLGGSGGDGTGGLGGIGGLGGGGGSVVALADNEDYPLRLAVDDTHVYWTCFAFPGAIRKVPIQGGTPVDLAVDQNHPKGLVVDSTHVYWTNSGDGTVRRVLKSGAGGAGGGSTTLYEHAGGGPAAGPAGIALDDSGRLLWTTFNLGTVEKDNKTGLNHATMVSGLSQPVGIVAYGANHSYWANHGSGVGGNGSIWELKFGGIPVYGPVVSGLAGPWDIAVTANGQLVWINNGVGPGDCSIMRYDQGGGSGGAGGGGPVSLVLPPDCVEPEGVAVDDTYVYWTDSANHKVMRVPLAGGAAEPVANAVQPKGIVVDDTYVYWANFHLDGSVMRAPKN